MHDETNPLCQLNNARQGWSGIVPPHCTCPVEKCNICQFEYGHSQSCSKYSFSIPKEGEKREMCDCWTNLGGKPAYIHMKDCRYYTPPQEGEKHDKCRKLGTSDMCVCCPCGCDIPLDDKHYSCFHGQKCEEHAPTVNLEWWNRKEMDEKLKGQVRTLVRLTELMPPKNAAELFAVVIPNLSSFIFKELSYARQESRAATIKRVMEVMPKEKIMRSWIGKAEQRFETDGYNKALSDLRTAIKTLAENKEKT